MNVCLVVSNDYLPFINILIDQTKVFIQAIFTHDRIFAVNNGCDKNRVFAYWQLRDEVPKLQPDYIVFLTDSAVLHGLQNELREIKFPYGRVIHASAYLDDKALEAYGRLKHYEKNPSLYKIFITGSSVAYYGIDETLLPLPTIHLAFPAQDIYFDYHIAKKILSSTPIKSDQKFDINVDILPENLESNHKVQTNFKYALVGFSPNVLHHDLSFSYWGLDSLPRYFLALHDFRHAGYTDETLKSIFKQKFLDEIELKGRDLFCRIPFYQTPMPPQEAVGACTVIRAWDHKYYPETLKENKQILEDYLSLLDLYKIKPILFITPRIKDYREHFNQRILNELFDFLNELYTRHDFIFINGWAMNEFDEHDFYDIYHMNIRGAHKFTKILSDVIMKLEGNN